jgi:iron complex outermembrane receptor protein
LGWTNTLTFGNGWDLNVFFRGAFGHDLLNTYRGFYENLESTTVNTWNIAKTDNYNPDVKKGNTNSTHVENASFIRLDNMSLGYNFDMANSDAFNDIRLFISGQNLFTLTGYSGIDPEVRYVDAEGGSPLAPGIERRNTYFTTRTISVGLNLSF